MSVDSGEDFIKYTQLLRQLQGSIKILLTATFSVSWLEGVFNTRAWMQCCNSLGMLQASCLNIHWNIYLRRSPGTYWADSKCLWHITKIFTLSLHFIFLFSSSVFPTVSFPSRIIFQFFFTLFNLSLYFFWGVRVLLLWLDGDFNVHWLYSPIYRRIMCPVC